MTRNKQTERRDLAKKDVKGNCVDIIDSGNVSDKSREPEITGANTRQDKIDSNVKDGNDQDVIPKACVFEILYRSISRSGVL